MSRSHADNEDAGEGYFASISDLMVGILFVFLLMLVVFAINYASEDVDALRRENTELKQRNAELDDQVKNQQQTIEQNRRQIADLTTERDKLRQGLLLLIEQLEKVSIGLSGEQGRVDDIRRELLFTLKRELEALHVPIEVVPGQGILRLSSEQLFVLNEANFTPKGADNARSLLHKMAQLLPCFSKSAEAVTTCSQQPIFETILIEGHTDTLPSPIDGGNWKLSTDRARAFLSLADKTAPVLDELRNSDGQRLLGLAGYGDSRPIAGIDGADQRNRRIEIRFLLSAQRGAMAEGISKLDALIQDLRGIAGLPP